MVQYKIAIDVMGSDNGPQVMTEGAVKAVEKHPELGVVLFGDRDAILEKLDLMECDRDRIEVVHASQVITNYDNPMEAIFYKQDSSLVKALVALGERDDLVGLINAGSTGAVLAGALRYVPAKELRRPALASLLPAEAGGYTCLVDTGASIDCTAPQLVEFAHMGSDFMKKFYRIENPRIGLYIGRAHV